MNIQDVEKLAETAKIELTDAEKEKLLTDIEVILAYVKQVNEVEIPDTAVQYAHRNIWREDSVSADGNAPDFSPALISGQFPEAVDGFVKFKKIL